ncbi:MAG TPA: HAD-IA family hydrolase [Myxococcota bacterium]|nr:HAD-IA family hydrolase [Myxococcota bacterium]
MQLGQRRFWIFDMDGTLTVAVHDFEAIRTELGLEPSKPILEQIAELPRERALRVSARLDAIELALAARARAAAGAHALLERLSERGARLGILTRNSFANACETLRACELAHFFEPTCVLGREAAAPKPDPQGIRRLLAHWSAEPREAVMVGDYRYDLLAGRAAGALTVYVDPEGAFPFAELADVAVDSLSALAERLA